MAFCHNNHHLTERTHPRRPCYISPSSAWEAFSLCGDTFLGSADDSWVSAAIILFPGGRSLIRIRRSFWPPWPAFGQGLPPASAAYQCNPKLWVWTPSKLENWQKNNLGKASKNGYFTVRLTLRAGEGGTVPQQGHNFDSSENDFFLLFSIFWDKIRTFLGNSRSWTGLWRFHSHFTKKSRKIWKKLTFFLIVIKNHFYFSNI